MANYTASVQAFIRDTFPELAEININRAYGPVDHTRNPADRVIVFGDYHIVMDSDGQGHLYEEGYPMVSFTINQ